MKIWLINQYASTPETGIGGRHYYLARELSKMGHSVHVIASSFTHLLHQPKTTKDQYSLETINDGFNVVWVKMPEYSGAHSKKRVLNWIVFACKFMKLHKEIPEKPDVILYSSPALLPFLGAWNLAFRLKAKLVWEIRDIWPLTLVELGGFSPFHPFIVIHSLIEKLAAKKADHIISNLPNAIAHLSSIGVRAENFTWVSNGVAVDEWQQNGAELLRDDVQAAIDQARAAGQHIIVYAGSHGLANALDNLLDAAVLLKGKPFCFILVGQGNDYDRLHKRVCDEEIVRVKMFPSLPKSQIPVFLAHADMAYLGLLRTPIFRFGVSPNKMFDYMMAGIPLLYAIDAHNDPASEHKCGISVAAENPTALAEAIQQLGAMPADDLKNLGKNGQEAALKYYSYEVLARKLVKALEGTASSTRL